MLQEAFCVYQDLRKIFNNIKKDRSIRLYAHNETIKKLILQTC